MLAAGSQLSDTDWLDYVDNSSHLHHDVPKGPCLVVSQASRLYRAFGLLQEMRTAGQAPDLITYHTLLRLCDQAGQGHSASTLSQVRDGDCAPRHKSFAGA